MIETSKSSVERSNKFACVKLKIDYKPHHKDGVLLTYGADILRYAISGNNILNVWFSFFVLLVFSGGLFRKSGFNRDVSKVVIEIRGAGETRLNILKLLLSKNFCVKALDKRLDISESAVSQKLKVLREADLVMGEKKGYFVHYMVKKIDKFL